MILGTTFSQIQCEYLRLDYKETLNEILTLPFEYIRIGAYWSEIEPKKSQYSFEKIDHIINLITALDKKIILAVGIKAPRWPEFHFPSWVKEKYNTNIRHTPLDNQGNFSSDAINFISTVLKRYKDNSAIEYIQIENEAFNNFGFTENKFLSYTFVKRAVSMARTYYPTKKILLTNAINLEPIDIFGRYSSAFNKSLSLADAIGINVYTNVPINKTHYAHPTLLYWYRLSGWNKKMQKLGIENWITEAQSEPWEYQNAVHTEKENYPSASPGQTVDLILNLNKIGYNRILLWGCEYWYWHKKQGKNAWWDMANTLPQLLQGQTQ